jgi:aryl-alcohol dehydrogenase-like predicted oxidoreductase
MTLTRKLNGKTIPALGLGCWAIGGPFYSGETPLGWGEIDDAVSMRAIDAAVDAGICFFDTAQAYGCGHSEIVLGRALKSKPDVQIGTKVGYAMGPESKQLTGEMLEPTAIKVSIDQSLQRLQRDHIDIVHLHLNEASIETAGLIFDTLADLRKVGKVLSFGWSTDFPDRAATFVKRDGFVAIQHAMNVFYRADMLVPTIEKNHLLSINRSPLAMGLLGGKHNASTQFSPDEVRGNMDGLFFRREDQTGICQTLICDPRIVAVWRPFIGTGCYCLALGTQCAYTAYSRFSEHCTSGGSSGRAVFWSPQHRGHGRD